MGSIEKIRLTKSVDAMTVSAFAELLAQSGFDVTVNGLRCQADRIQTPDPANIDPLLHASSISLDSTGTKTIIRASFSPLPVRSMDHLRLAVMGLTFCISNAVLRLVIQDTAEDLLEHFLGGLVGMVLVFIFVELFGRAYWRWSTTTIAADEFLRLLRSAKRLGTNLRSSHSLLS